MKLVIQKVLVLAWIWSGCNSFSVQHTLFPSSRVTSSTSLHTATETVGNNPSPSQDDDNNNDAMDSTFPSELFEFPTHSNKGVNEILSETEAIIRDMQDVSSKNQLLDTNPLGSPHDTVFANTYVDLGKVDTVGFDYDYTLVTYTEELLELIYDKALNRLVNERQYPVEMIGAGLKFDPCFSIRGLAVDKVTGWICHLSYTHKVAVAWEGRQKVPTSRIYKEYRGKRALIPTERKSRLKPLNDLFSMSECCLIADVIEFFKKNNYDYCPSNVVTDVLLAIRDTHMSGDFHRLVAEDPAKYFHPSPNLKTLLLNLIQSGKRLMFVSNSPFWYVDAGMKYVIGNNWREMWDAIIVSAGKPIFYTDHRRPFREVNLETSRVKFTKVSSFEHGKVYTEGCLRQLIKLMDWSDATGGDRIPNTNIIPGAVSLATSNVLYIGDSLFADLVDAKREFGWITAAVFPEVGVELELQKQSDFITAQRAIEFLLTALRLVQEELGPVPRTEEDMHVLDSVERLISRWRDRETQLLGNPFGSVFRARYQPSLFAHSLRRYCDLYMSNLGNLANYSPQHRFYPEPGFRLLAHEIAEPECYVMNQSFNGDGA